jgi:hypothetical protein
MLAELRVEGAEQQIQEAVAEQHHLDIERYRIRLEGDGARQADQTADVLDNDFAAPQHPLERRPAERFGQKIAGVEQEIAAVGAMNGACLDQAKVGDERALVGDMLDGADQIAERRM